MTASTNPEQATLLATVMVNYRAGDLIIANLPGLVDQHKAVANSHIYIVDNLSDNGDAQKLAAYVDARNLGQHITVIAHPANSGWGSGNNVGVRAVLAAQRQTEFVLFLNPDASLLPRCLDNLIAFMQAHPKAGFAGCRIEDPQGAVQSSAFRFFSPASEFESTIRTGPFSQLLKRFIVVLPEAVEPTKVDWVSGAAFMARRTAVIECDLFDEGYFLYFDETDMMKTAKRKGWEAWHLPDARAIHMEGFSTGTKGGVNVEQPISEHYFRSRNYYLRKHHGLIGHLLADMAWLSGACLYAVRCVLTGKPSKPQWRRVGDFLSHFGKSQRLK